MWVQRTDSNGEGVGKRKSPVSENTKNRGFLEARMGARDPGRPRHSTRFARSWSLTNENSRPRSD
jgi:hypothetical protein